MSQSARRDRAPTQITVVRVLVTIQVVGAAALAGLFSTVVVSSYRLDRAAARSGDSPAEAGLGEFFGTALVIICIGAILVIGIPLLRLRVGRSGARLALIIGEVVLAVPLTPSIGTLSSTSQQVSAVSVGVPVFAALPLVVIVLLFSAQARSWSRRPATAMAQARA